MKVTLVFAFAMATANSLSAEALVRVRVFTQIERRTHAALLEVVKAETGAILLPAGVDLEWSPIRQSLMEAVSSQVAVVRFKGNCDPEGVGEFRTLKQGALGVTHRAAEGIIPFSDIYCDEIGSFLSRAMSNIPRRLQEDVFGKAVARVVAHELYHILAKTNRHGPSGIAKDCFTPADLLSRLLVFRRQDCDLLRARVRMSDRGELSASNEVPPPTAIKQAPPEPRRRSGRKREGTSANDRPAQ